MFTSHFVADDSIAIVVALREDTRRDQIAPVLSPLGRDVYFASSGEDAWTTIASTDRPTIVILDCELDGLSEHEILARLSVRPYSTRTYSIVLIDSVPTRAVFGESGARADDYLFAPYTEEEMAVRLALAEKCLLDAQHRTGGAGSMPQSVRNVFDAQLLLDRFEMVSTHMADGVTLFGGDDLRILWCNPVRAAIAKATPRQLVGRFCHEAFSSHQTPCDPCPVREAFRSGRTHHREMVLADGSVYDVLAVPVWDEGQVRAVVETMRDITDLRRLEEQYRREKTKAEAATKAKSAFLAHMSHEVRTPMSGILTVAEILSRRELSPEVAEPVNTIRDSARSLLQILNDLLDFSRLEANRIELEQQIFSPRDLFGSACALFRGHASEKGLLLREECDEGMPELLVGDEGRIRQIVHNLLSNAIKFTPQGSVVLSARWDASRLVFTVSDTGIGMSAEFQNRVFNRFEQADASFNRRYGGTGLGLSICRELVTLMHGELDLSSELDVGSRFEVRLPLEIATHQDAMSDVGVVQEGHANRAMEMKILYADDAPLNQKVLRMILVDSLGCEVDVADDGAQAAMMAEQRRYDAILLDCHMPEMNGFETAEYLHRTWAARQAPAVPLVAVTADLMPETRQRCRDCGMVDFVTKPFELAEVERVMRRLAVRTAGLADGATSDVAGGLRVDAKASIESPSALDVERALELALGDVAVAADMAEASIVELADLLDTVVAAVMQDDRAALRRAIHAFRGAAGNVGATELSEQMRITEKHLDDYDENRLRLFAATLQETYASFAEAAQAFVDGIRQ